MLYELQRRICLCAMGHCAKPTIELRTIQQFLKACHFLQRHIDAKKCMYINSLNSWYSICKQILCSLHLLIAKTNYEFE
jgi:hypothetical protein